MTINLDNLNEQQKNAVLSRSKNTLVLAGAGSGKTKVLTTRVSYLLEIGVDISSVLCVTFTNKAAKEMKDRIISMNKDKSFNFNNLWIGTFHSICNKILKEHYIYKNFVIIDDQDQKKIIKNILTKKNFKKINNENISIVLDFISYCKNKVILPKDSKKYEKNFPEIFGLSGIYDEYEKEKDLMNLLDFDDLILKTVLLLKNNDKIHKNIQTQFKHILVDEYQDTNNLQSCFLDLIHYDNNYLFVVGDEDQSIYGWRGSVVNYILNFEKKYHDSFVVLLEENYRSTKNILDAANAVISQNEKRYGKKLFTSKKENPLLYFYEATSPDNEAYHVSKKINYYIKNGYNYSDIAILYRNNFISRNFESYLSNFKIPYKLIGGVGFWSRKEIKDLLSFMYVSFNINLNIQTERTFSLLDGIGIKTIEKIKEYSSINKVNYFISVKKMMNENLFKGKTKLTFEKYISVFENSYSKHESPFDLASFFVNEFSLRDFYIKKEGEEKGGERVSNISEMLFFLKKFKSLDLNDFFETIMLQQDLKSDNDSSDFVNLMTIHSSKGLEFPIVFLVGIENNIIPSERSFLDNDLLEEERRLMYVAITRSMNILNISCSPYRFGGKETGKSCFINDIPHSCFTLNNKYKIGDEIKSEVYGDGVILDINIIGNEMLITADFDFIGKKIIKKTP